MLLSNHLACGTSSSLETRRWTSSMPVRMIFLAQRRRPQIKGCFACSGFPPWFSSKQYSKSKSNSFSCKGQGLWQALGWIQASWECSASVSWINKSLWLHTTTSPNKTIFWWLNFLNSFGNPLQHSLNADRLDPGKARCKAPKRYWNHPNTTIDHQIQHHRVQANRLTFAGALRNSCTVRLGGRKDSFDFLVQGVICTVRTSYDFRTLHLLQLFLVKTGSWRRRAIGRTVKQSPDSPNRLNSLYVTCISAVSATWDLLC